MSDRVVNGFMLCVLAAGILAWRSWTSASTPPIEVQGGTVDVVSAERDASGTWTVTMSASARQQGMTTWWYYVGTGHGDWGAAISGAMDELADSVVAR